MQKPPRRRIRRLFQFGLKTVILVTVACAVGLTWWRQRSLIDELAASRQRLEWQERELDHRENLLTVYESLDINEPQHRELLAALRSIPGRWPASFDRKCLYRGRGNGDLEVLLFHYRSWGRGLRVESATVAVLLWVQQRKIVDFVARNLSGRDEAHGASLEDLDGDGTFELIIDCEPWRRDSQPFVIAYRITSKGFVQMSEPPRPFRPIPPVEPVELP